MAAKYSGTPWPCKRVPVEESPFEFVVRMQSNNLRQPTKLVLDETAFDGMPASIFIRPHIPWEKRVSREEYDEAPDR